MCKQNSIFPPLSVVLPFFVPLSYTNSLFVLAWKSILKIGLPHYTSKSSVSELSFNTTKPKALNVNKAFKDPTVNPSTDIEILNKPNLKFFLGGGGRGLGEVRYTK